MCQLLLTGKMKVGEHHLSFPHQRILGGNRLFHLDNHLRLGVDILDGGEDGCSHLGVSLIAETATFASSVLYEDGVPTAY